MSREVRAIQIAIATSIVGTLAKFTAGVITANMSMISSGVDSLGDLFVSIANLVVVHVSASEPDDDHNYGHHKIEGLGAMFEGGFVFAAAMFIVYESVHKAMLGEVSHDSALGVAVMVPVLILTFGTVLHLRKVAKETGSLVVKSDAMHYMTDVWVNVGVLVSLALGWLTGEPLVDTVISILIALSMIRSSFLIVREGFDVVMDTSLDVETTGRIRSILDGCDEIRGYHDFRTRGGRVPHVDFHVVVAGETTTRQVHDLFLVLRDRIQAVVGPATKVLIHADPE